VQEAQIVMLAHIKAGGEIPFREPVTRAPQGTTVDALLDVNKHPPPENGMYNLGTLRVPVDEFPAFANAQREMCRENLEARDLLYHMQNGQGATPVTVRLQPDVEAGAQYIAGSNTIFWSPTIAARDAATKHIIPPATALLHEETHWAAGELGQVLKKIPDKQFGNYEEKRVITGAEARDLHLRALPYRESHEGQKVPVRDINSVEPVIEINSGHGSMLKGPGFQQSGHIVDVDDKTVKVQTLEKDASSIMTFRKSDLSMAMGAGNETGAKVLRDAKDFKDHVSIHVTHDGAYYDNPKQFERFQREGGNQRMNELGVHLQRLAEQAHVSHAQTQALSISK
jgi:hypothetical protein